MLTMVGGGVDMKGIYAEYECERGHRTRIYNGHKNEIYFQGYDYAPNKLDEECDECLVN